MKIKDLKDKLNKIGLRFIYEFDDNTLVKRGEKIDFIDNQGYKYKFDYSQIRDLFNGKYKLSIVNNSNPYTIENIKNYININNGSCKLLSTQWVGGSGKLKLKCKCGREYEARWYHLFANKKFQCNKCGYKNHYNKKSFDESEKTCEKHGYHIIKDTYKSRKCFDMVDKLGYKYSNCSIYQLDKRTNKSKRFSYNNKYQLYNMQLYIKINNCEVLLCEDNKNVHSNEFLNALCVSCGEKYKATWEQLLGNKNVLPRIRCEKCSKAKSNLEYLVEEYLKENCIKYEYQKRFPWCKNIRELPFDFYLIDYNTVIEVNGSQHYYENKVFERSLREQQEIDIYKKKCCEEHNIKFVEIPFWLILQSKSNTYKKIIDNIIG